MIYVFQIVVALSYPLKILQIHVSHIYLHQERVICSKSCNISQLVGRSIHQQQCDCVGTKTSMSSQPYLGLCLIKFQYWNFVSDLTNVNYPKGPKQVQKICRFDWSQIFKPTNEIMVAVTWNSADAREDFRTYSKNYTKRAKKKLEWNPIPKHVLYYILKCIFF